MAAELQFTRKQVANPENTYIVSLIGDIDESNQSALVQLFEEMLVDPQVQNIVFNIQKLDYMNSGVIGLFAQHHSLLSEVDKQFVFSEANENIFDIIDLVGLTSVIECFETDNEACLSFED